MWLFGATVALSVAGFWLDFLGVLVWGVDALLVCGLAFDYLRIPGAAKIEVERSLPERVGLSREFRRSLTVGGANLAGRRVEVHERFPELFSVCGRSVGGRRVATSEFSTSARVLRPLAAGSERLLRNRSRPDHTPALGTNGRLSGSRRAYRLRRPEAGRSRIGQTSTGSFVCAIAITTELVSSPDAARPVAGAAR